MKNRDPRFSKIRHDLTTTISTLQSLIKKLNAPEPKLTEAKYYMECSKEKSKEETFGYR
jgi:hypothetical protein